MKGFFRLQEERFALRLLTWQYQKNGLSVPPEPELSQRAAGLVDEAHRIGAERGRNVLSILKELAESVLKKKQ
ncbi:MAG: hypothetical protein ACOWWM_11550 [Desulfobacterales bacterium]